jgi:hypothetical protein
VQAAELQVIAGDGIAGALNEIATIFERAAHDGAGKSVLGDRSGLRVA